MDDIPGLKNAIIRHYLRGLGGQVVRRRKHTEPDTDEDMLHFNDMMGTAREETNPVNAGTEAEGTPYGYVVTADGEPLSVEQPSDLENHIQFHGGFLEDHNIHTNPSTDGVMGYFYRMGIRHYSPSLGRFLQRDPFTYLRAPHKSSPLSLNPYSYGNNNPLQMSDTSGYQACPGSCGAVPGFATPKPSGGMGTDPGAPGGDPGGGTNDPDKSRQCLRLFPQECKKEGVPEFCYPCCQWDDDPPWGNSCCGAVSLPYSICNDTEPYDPNDPCNCACCWSGGEENSPTPIGGGGSSSGGHSWFRPIFGPPSIGPFGDGGDPWNFHPRPLGEIFPWRPEYNGLMVWNSFKDNMSAKSNLIGNLSPMFAWIIVGGLLLGIVGVLTPYLFCLRQGCIHQNPYKNILFPKKSDEICDFWHNCICVCCSSYYSTMAVAGIAALFIGLVLPPAGLGVALVGTGMGIYACLMSFNECIDTLSEFKINRAKANY